jgi:hypothetical protein
MENLTRRGVLAATIFLSFGGHAAFAAACGVTAPNITGAQYNTYRTSTNLQETALTPATVQSGFGYLFSMAPAAGLIYAQPLIMHNFTIAGTCHATVIFVATMKNQIFAYDGDSLSTTPLWASQTFGTAVSSGSVAFPALYCRTNVGFTSVGILSTPVIDANHGLMYFVTLNDAQKATTCTATGSTGWIYTLHAMSIKNDSTFGLDYIPAHDINGDLSPYGFVATQALQRPALFDAQGGIFIGFGFGTSTNGGGEIESNYQGWMAQYNSCSTSSSSCPTTTCVTNTNCSFFYASAANPGPLSSHGAGVWMSGAGPATDGTYYAFSTGNGCYPDANSTPQNCSPILDNGLGDSVVYRPTSTTNPNLGSTFTPESTTESPGFMNYYVDDYNDLDVSSGGVVMVPPVPPKATSSYVIASGKAGQTYVLPTSNLGGYTSTPYQGFLSAPSTAPCSVPFPVSPQTPLYGGIVPTGGGCAEIHNPAWWNLSQGTGMYLVWGFGDVPRGYYFNGSMLETTEDSATPPIAGTATSQGGGALAVSANGGNDATAILWAVTSVGFSSKGAFIGGALEAYQLYSSGGAYEIAPLYNTEEQSGKTFHAQRYVVPLVNNGKVYVSAVSSGNGLVLVYGPCSQGPNGVCGVQPKLPN